MQSDLGILCLLTYTTVSIDSVSGKRRPRSASACVKAQGDLGLRIRKLHKGHFRAFAHRVQVCGRVSVFRFLTLPGN